MDVVDWGMLVEIGRLGEVGQHRECSVALLVIDLEVEVCDIIIERPVSLLWVGV